MKTQSAVSFTRIQLVGGAVVTVMTAALVYGFSTGNLLSDGRVLLQHPWGLVSLVEVYAGLTLFAGWIVWREERLAAALSWVLAMLVVGNLVAGVYVLRCAYRAGGDIDKFWMGKGEVN